MDLFHFTHVKSIQFKRLVCRFLIINKGFVSSEFNTDIELPQAVKTENAETFKTQIEEVLKTEDLSKLLEYLPTII